MSQNKSSGGRGRGEIALYRYALSGRWPIRPCRPRSGQAGPRAGRPGACRAVREPVTVSSGQSGPLDPGVAGRRVRRAGPGRTAGAARTDAAVLELAAQLKRSTRPAPPRISPGSSPPNRGGPLGAHPAAPFRPPGAEHPPRRQPAEGLRPVRSRRVRPAVGVRRVARPDHRRPQGGAVRAAGRPLPLCGRAPLGHGEDTLGMQAALHDAVKTHGCPQRLYCDNGSAYSSASMSRPGAAVLDIKLVHSAPGRPQDEARSNAGIAPFATSSWSRSTHQVHVAGRAQPIVHRVAAPAVPPRRALRNRGHPGAAVPRRGPRPAAQPDPAWLRRAFLWREQRKVTSFATVSLHGAASRSTRPWRAAPSMCCSPRST